MFHDTIRANLLYARPDADDAADLGRAARGADRAAGAQPARRARHRRRRPRLPALRRRAAAARDRAPAAQGARRSSCSTRRPPTSTASPRPPCSGPSTRRSRAARRWSSPTGSRRCATPTPILVVDGGRIVQSGTHAELLAAGRAVRRPLPHPVHPGRPGRLSRHAAGPPTEEPRRMDLDLDRPRVRGHRGRSRPRPGHRRLPGRRGRPGGALRALRGDAARRGRRRWATPRVTVVADNADPATPGAAARGRARALGPRSTARWSSVGGPPKGPVTGDHRRAVERRVRVGVPRRGAARPRGRRRRCRGGGSLAFVLSSSVRAPLPDMAISNGLRPGLAMVAKTLADELGPARRPGQRRCCPAGSAPSGSPSSTPPPATPSGAREARSADDPAGPLRRAGGVRPGGGLPARRRRRPSSPASMLPVDGGMLRAL